LDGQRARSFPKQNGRLALTREAALCHHICTRSAGRECRRGAEGQTSRRGRAVAGRNQTCQRETWAAPRSGSDRQGRLPRTPLRGPLMRGAHLLPPIYALVLTPTPFSSRTPSAAREESSSTGSNTTPPRPRVRSLASSIPL
jgi:hypothetical protein